MLLLRNLGESVPHRHISTCWSAMQSQAALAETTLDFDFKQGVLRIGTTDAQRACNSAGIHVIGLMLSATPATCSLGTECQGSFLGLARVWQRLTLSERAQATYLRYWSCRNSAGMLLVQSAMP